MHSILIASFVGTEGVDLGLLKKIVSFAGTLSIGLGKEMIASFAGTLSIGLGKETDVRTC